MSAQTSDPLPGACAEPAAASRGMGFAAGVWDALLSLLYPPHCLVCRTPLEEAAEGLCPGCWRRLQVIDGPVCGRCGCPSTFPRVVCDNCRDRDYPFSGVRCLAPFGPDIQTLLHGLKYRGRLSVARVLGRRLGQVLADGGFVDGIDVLHPVPLHPARRRERGYNQSTLVARSVSDVVGLPLAENLVKRTRMTRSQTGLDLGARAQNVSGAFVIRKAPGLEGSRILLVDDVVTTGATCGACAEALLDSGAEEVRVAGLASPYFEAGPDGDPAAGPEVEATPGRAAGSRLTP